VLEHLLTTQRTRANTRTSGGLEARTRQHELLYNSGIAQLVAGNAESAFDCFFHAAQLYYNSPRLWLRLAECIVAVHSTKVQ